MLAETDEHHERAAEVFADLLQRDRVVTHNYVVVEATTLVRTRLGVAAVRVLHDELLAPVRVTWVDEQVHTTGVASLLAAPRGGPSLVDWVSFEVMRRFGIERAFAFDRDFRRQGFATIP